MTPAAIPNPGVMGITPAAMGSAPIAADAAAGGAVANAAVSGGQPAGSNSVFPAVLQALRTPAKPGEVPVLPSAAQDATGLGAPPPFSLQLPAQAAAASPADAAPPCLPAATDEQTLPPDGTNLPPGLDVEALLRSLALPPVPAAPGTGIEAGLPNTPAEMPLQELQARLSLPARAQTAGHETAADSAGVAGNSDALVDQLLAIPVDAGSAQLGALPASADAGSPGLDLASLQAPAVRSEMLNAALQAIRTPADPAAAAMTFAPLGATVTATDGSTSNSATILPGPMPTLQPLVDGEAWSKNLGDRLLMMAENGMQTARLKLHPEHLGPLEIRISVDDDGASQVWFSAQHSQTREAIEQALPRLRELFADQGLNLAHANVDSGRGAFAQRNFATLTDAWSPWDSDEIDTQATANITAWQIGRGTARRLDVLV